MIAGPPVRWIAPSTPPPPRSPSFAALTMASAGIRVMSPRTIARTLVTDPELVDGCQVTHR
jgi:hypothetical protein